MAESFFTSEKTLENVACIVAGGALLAVGQTAGVELIKRGTIEGGAFAAGKFLKSQLEGEKTSRAVFEAVISSESKLWHTAKKEDGQAAIEFFKGNVDNFEFPVEDARKIVELSGKEDGIYKNLAKTMVHGAPLFGALEPNIQEIVLDILTEAIKKGLFASAQHEKELTVAFFEKLVGQGEKIQATQDLHTDLLNQILAQVSQNKQSNPNSIIASIEDKAIIALAKNVAKDENINDVAQAWKELENAISIYLEFREKAARGTNDGELIDQTLKKIAELSAQGKFDEGAQLADNEFELWKKQEAERREVAKQKGISFLNMAIDQYVLKRDAKMVAARVFEKLKLENEAGNFFDPLRTIQNEFYVRGDQGGINFDLEIAIELARICVKIASNSDEIGIAYNNLGNALWSLGERESGTAKLEEAVLAYKDALKEYTRDKVPLQWATTQNNLGAALWKLGERESGTAKLEEAVLAYKEALKERTQDKVPLDWAMTQNNLGTALSSLGERESGTAKLEEAVLAYEEALKEMTRDKVPLDWAMTQNNLGFALMRLGERESGTAKLEEAVLAYKEALKERTQDKVPLDWAMTQNNLGTALSSLGERESGTAKLESAVNAYLEALKERTQDKVPLGWAVSTGNKAHDQALIAKRSKNCTLLKAAIEDLKEVISVFEAANHQGFLPFCNYALSTANSYLQEVCD